MGLTADDVKSAMRLAGWRSVAIGQLHYFYSKKHFGGSFASPTWHTWAVTFDQYGHASLGLTNIVLHRVDSESDSDGYYAPFVLPMEFLYEFVALSDDMYSQLDMLNKRVRLAPYLITILGNVGCGDGE